MPGLASRTEVSQRRRRQGRRRRGQRRQRPQRVVRWRESTVHLRLRNDVDRSGFYGAFLVSSVAFEKLCRLLGPTWMALHHPGGRSGKPRAPSPSAPGMEYHLAVLLSWLASRDCVLHRFEDRVGLSDASLSTILHDMMLIFVEVMKDNEEASVRWPSLERQRLFARIHLWYCNGEERFGEGVRVIGFLDGTRKQATKAYKAVNFFMQNASYNGSLHHCCKNNVLVCGPDGRIFWTHSNEPGSWHDNGRAMYLLLEGLSARVDRLHPHRHRLIADSGFLGTSVSEKLAECLICVPKVGVAPSRQSRRVNPATPSAVIRTYRQPAEWIMHDLNNSTPRLRWRLPIIADRSGLMLRTAQYFHNWRTANGASSQVRTVFWDAYFDAHPLEEEPPF